MATKAKTAKTTKTKASQAKASKVQTASKAPEAAKVETPAPQAKAEKPTPQAKQPTPAQSAYAPDAKIALLVKENPHRAGTILHTYYGKYQDGMTVQQALEAGIIAINLRYLSQRKIIRIG